METETLSRRVGQLLRTLRQERRWTIDTAAEKLDIEPSTLGAYERGARRITLNALFERILEGYGITFLQLAQRLSETESQPMLEVPSRNEQILALTHTIKESSDELALLITQSELPNQVA